MLEVSFIKMPSLEIIRTKCCFLADGRSCYPDLSDGGALQVSIHGFQVDYFPFHLAKSNRAHWPK